MAEFAISLPVLLLVLLATAEIGRGLYQYNMLEKSVRDATRFLSANATQDGTGLIHIDDLQDDIKNLVVYGDRIGNGDPILPDLEPDDVTVVDLDGVHVQVSVNYPYQTMLGTAIPTFGFGSGSIDSALTFISRTTMRAL